MIVTGNSIYTPEGYVIDMRNKTINIMDNKITIKKDAIVNLKLKDILDCQQQIHEHIKNIDKILDTSVTLGNDINKMKRELDNIKMEFIYLLEQI